MRPLRLEIEGLRSYRHKQTIDLDKRGLVAIIGDTGAGKSSILEGLTYALYNATTWDQRGVKALLADGARKLAVVLDFSAEGKEWRVTRSTGALPIHELRCLSHPDDPLGRVDGESAVNSGVEKLVGLSYEAFCSAVLLPQGRFQQLLTSSPRDRTAILKGILRVDDLETVRSLASGAVERIRPELYQRAEERARYFSDPAARAAQAAEQREHWDEQVSQLTALCDRVESDAQSASLAHNEAARLDGIRVGLLKALTGQAATLAALATIEGEIAELLAAAEENGREAGERERAAAGLLDDANNAGFGLTDAAALLATLDRVAGDITALAEGRNELETLQAAQTGIEALAASDPARIATLEKAESDAASAVAQTETDLKTAQERLASVQEVMRRYRQATADADAAALAATNADAEWQASAADLESKRAAAESSVLDATSAQEAWDALQRHNAAAHAAQGMSVGDLCPICVRPLPDGFRMPEIAGEKQALARLKKARDACSKAERDEAIAVSAMKMAVNLLAEAQGRQQEAETRRETLSAEATATLGADVTLADAILFTSPQREIASTGDALANARKALLETANELAVARNEVNRREEAISAARAATTKAQEQVHQLVTRIDKACASIPEPYRPVTPITVDGCAAARSVLECRAGELSAIEGKRRDAGARRASAEQECEKLRKRHHREVEGPSLASAQPLAALHYQLALAAPEVGLSTPQAQPTGSATSDRAQWAQLLEQEASKISALLVPLADEARAMEHAAQATLKTALEGAGFASAKDLADAKRNAEAERFAASKAEKEALDQVPLADRLDKRIRPAQALLNELEELVSLLSDAKFIRYVVESKQLALLAVASAILGDMSGGRYGCAENFQIVDRLSGQPRDAKTLSGGETFLASLALALALVEIAGRAGGRLEALFLDEGFGSLDGSSLDEAMTALEHVTGDERLVAVISHLKAIAERVENVLYVKRDVVDRSSQATWIGTTEKDQLIEDEMEQGLLA